MENLLRVTEHQRRALERAGVADASGACCACCAPATGGPGTWTRRAGSGAASRSSSARSPTSGPASAAQALEAARAFGRFAASLADLPPPPLRTTIPGFHDLALRRAALEAAVREDAHGRARGLAREIDGARAVAQRIAAAQDEDALPRRAVHNDCKLNNLLFDAERDEALCVVDLDTVMEGALLHDFGELVRTATNARPEDEPDPDTVQPDLALHEALARGYLEGVGRADDPGGARVAARRRRAHGARELDPLPHRLPRGRPLLPHPAAVPQPRPPSLRSCGSPSGCSRRSTPRGVRSTRPPARCAAARRSARPARGLMEVRRGAGHGVLREEAPARDREGVAGAQAFGGSSASGRRSTAQRTPPGRRRAATRGARRSCASARDAPRPEGQHEEVTAGAELDLEIAAAGTGEEALDDVVLPETRDARAGRRVRDARRRRAARSSDAHLELGADELRARALRAARRRRRAVPEPLDRQAQPRRSARDGEQAAGW